MTETEEVWAENTEPLTEADDPSFEVGDRVRVWSDDPEADTEAAAYDSCEGVVKARGKGRGFYSGSIVYDVDLDECSEPVRLTADDLEPA